MIYESYNICIKVHLLHKGKDQRLLNAWNVIVDNFDVRSNISSHNKTFWRYLTRGVFKTWYSSSNTCSNEFYCLKNLEIYSQPNFYFALYLLSAYSPNFKHINLWPSSSPRCRSTFLAFSVWHLSRQTSWTLPGIHKSHHLPTKNRSTH